MFEKKKKNYNTNKKRYVEIYFILYLVAIVMLISTGREKNTNEDNMKINEIEFPFRIKPEKPLLTCKIITDTNGVKKYQLDSINYIPYYGNVSDVKYEFIIEDDEFKNKILLLNNSNNENQIFSFDCDDDNKVVRFIWYPNIETATNKNFNVYVTATAKYKSNTGVEQELQSKTQFVLSIYNDYLLKDGYEIVSNNTFESSQTNLQYYQNQVIYSDFSINPQQNIIRGIAGDIWENEVYCYGFNPKTDLLKAPIIELNNTPIDDNGSKIISNILKDNSIFLKGKVPDFGRTKVLISVQRKGDLKEQKISFDVSPIHIQLPEVPSAMYPNVEYSINPNIPSDLTDITLYIKEIDNDKVRLSSFNNSIIKFTPNKDDIGKTLLFERYYNNKLIGQKHQIKVLDFAPPKITRLSEKNKNEHILETISYGLHNSLDNTIKEVRLTGNAEYSQQHGKTRTNRTKLEFVEQYSITPKDNSKPFKYSVYVIDQNGKSSNTINTPK
ncbi:MAG: hypothetical protein FWG85_05140 [Bacteroidetes bacterium]|nr:hypothetical protein [Bacteroidota bacterium]